jgi:hypothetical protein
MWKDHWAIIKAYRELGHGFLKALASGLKN